jgi:glycosyltransferase involved in cell wall biosynthesis
MQKKFSLVMATYDDTVRTLFTSMSALLNQSHVGEIVVVDNNPNSSQGTQLRNFCNGTDRRIKYVPMENPKGTSAPRNRAIDEAQFDHVICTDSHVIFPSGSINSVYNFYEKHGWDNQDLLHGPLMNESLRLHSHLMNDQWRSEMWGTWGLAWITPDKELFTCWEPKQNEFKYRPINEFNNELRQYSDFDTLNIINKKLPKINSWAGHERILYDAGCSHPTEEFEIPGYGMGVFATRKDSWLRFPDKCLGFGGEEMSIHVKYRQNKRKVWCLPTFAWWHHFTEGGRPYRLTLWDKVRNYCVWFNELNLPLDDIRKHFVDEIRMNPNEFEQAATGMEWPNSPAKGIDPQKFTPNPIKQTNNSQPKSLTIETPFFLPHNLNI